MNVAVLSVTYPYGTNEPYLEHEVRELARAVGSVRITPVNPSPGAQRSLPSCVTLQPIPDGFRRARRALRACVRQPATVASVVAELLLSHSPLRTKLKNLAVLGRALALAESMRDTGVDHVHAYWLSTPATVAYVVCRLLRIPFSATAHRWDIYERNALDCKVHRAAFVRTISDRGRRDLAARVAAPIRDKIATLPLGVPIPPRTSPPFRASQPLRLLCPAALVPVKGHDTLLRALSRVVARGVAVECTFAGDGPLRASLQRRVRALKLEANVRFAGVIPQRALHAALERGEYHAVVLASLESGEGTMEGVPSALVEAMARGVPVIATVSGSIGELVDARTGVLVAPGEAAPLAEALVACARHFPEHVVRARRAYAAARARHDLVRQMNTLALWIAYSATRFDERKSA